MSLPLGKEIRVVHVPGGEVVYRKTVWFPDSALSNKTPERDIPGVGSLELNMFLSHGGQSACRVVGNDLRQSGNREDGSAVTPYFAEMPDAFCIFQEVRRCQGQFVANRHC